MLGEWLAHTSHVDSANVLQIRQLTHHVLEAGVCWKAHDDAQFGTTLLTKPRRVLDVFHEAPKFDQSTLDLLDDLAVS